MRTVIDEWLVQLPHDKCVTWFMSIKKKKKIFKVL